MKAPQKVVQSLSKAYSTLKLRTELTREDGQRLFVAGDDDCQFIFTKDEAGRMQFQGGALSFGGLEVIILDDYELATTDASGDLGYIADEELGEVLLAHLENLERYFTILASR